MSSEFAISTILDQPIEIRQGIFKQHANSKNKRGTLVLVTKTFIWEKIKTMGKSRTVCLSIKNKNYFQANLAQAKCQLQKARFTHESLVKGH